MYNVLTEAANMHCAHLLANCLGREDNNQLHLQLVKAAVDARMRFARKGLGYFFHVCNVKAAILWHLVNTVQCSGDCTGQLDLQNEIIVDELEAEIFDDQAVCKFRLCTVILQMVQILCHLCTLSSDVVQYCNTGRVAHYAYITQINVARWQY
jgi:hypothetical protein